MTPEEFRAIRKQLGLTQVGLAQLTGYGAGTRIAEFESDLVDPVDGRPKHPIPPLLERLMRAYEAGYVPADLLERRERLAVTEMRLLPPTRRYGEDD